MSLKKRTGYVAGLVAGAMVAAATMYLSYTKLKEPQNSWDWAGFLDWSSLIFSGLTTGIIAFFVVWGHFQKDPEARQAQ